MQCTNRVKYNHDMTLSDYIYAEKMKIGLAELAERLQTPERTIISWLYGHRRPNVTKAAAIRDLTGLSFDEIFAAPIRDRRGKNES